MSTLAQKSCEACRAGAPEVSLEDARELLLQLPQWRMENHLGVMKLIREIQFKKYGDALEFTQCLGELAEQEQHHPAILTEWGKVTVFWWTHKIRGLHVNDFIMAAKTNELAESARNDVSR